MSSNRYVVSYWTEWFGGCLKEDKAIYTSVQVMHQGFGFFLVLRATNRAAPDPLGTSDVSLQ